MNETCKIFFNDGMKEFKFNEMLNELNKHGAFNVFCEFIDPKTNCLVQAYVNFYPNPQTVYNGLRSSFIAEKDGVYLYIPSDFEWWANKQSSGKATIKYKTSVLIKGCFTQIDFNLDVSPHIRVDAYLNKRAEPFYAKRLLQLKDRVNEHIDSMRERAILREGVRGITAANRYKELKALKLKLS